MSARATVEDYYEALRRGEPLYPYFAEEPDAVKFGVGETLAGYDAIAEGLREQTRTTTDWVVESDALRVVERDGHATFSDSVRMAWTDTDAETDYDFDTRWSGTLERRVTAGDDAEEWVFLGMHVSVAYEREDE
ncbi:nuclear transport factor 2 family protein [Halogeometricum limi]|uniref:SnoaL-like domain-containing protein n=1 Tax=Halogeometricum limi TaxID=555875 RepID=A0A1I6HZ58_9EURY|nr:nuclear transport factor 2 family protein [Halogeometricum limi]SFR59733.1 SnoaL-like domain-containing protein [Halogeometricum limi]